MILRLHSTWFSGSNGCWVLWFQCFQVSGTGSLVPMVVLCMVLTNAYGSGILRLYGISFPVPNGIEFS